jgi:aminomethyltransferase
VLAEHTAVRAAVGLFDVSHLGTAVIRGTGADGTVDRAFTNALDRVGPGQAQYTLCCNDDGGTIDDLIVYRRGVDDLLIVPNAANSAAVLQRLRLAAPEGVEITDFHRDLAILAVQGPRSAALLAAVGLPADLEYMAFVDGAGDTGSVTVCRTGYTGEPGYELICPAAEAVVLWDALVAAGGPFGLLPAGLGARDTLRTEMGYPLHGQELSEAISPVTAGLSWAVGWEKPEFSGRDALLAERAAGPVRRLRGIRLTDRGVPRPGMTVTRGGTPIGELTSGTFSPTLRCGIGLALIDAAVQPGAAVAVLARGRDLAAEVVRTPFVERRPT